MPLNLLAAYSLCGLISHLPIYVYAYITHVAYVPGIVRFCVTQLPMAG